MQASRFAFSLWRNRTAFPAKLQIHLEQHPSSNPQNGGAGLFIRHGNMKPAGSAPVKSPSPGGTGVGPTD